VELSAAIVVVMRRRDIMAKAVSGIAGSGMFGACLLASRDLHAVGLSVACRLVGSVDGFKNFGKPYFCFQQNYSGGEKSFKGREGLYCWLLDYAIGS
jgi:hypothetical protein